MQTYAIFSDCWHAVVSATPKQMLYRARHGLRLVSGLRVYDGDGKLIYCHFGVKAEDAA